MVRTENFAVLRALADRDLARPRFTYQPPVLFTAHDGHYPGAGETGELDR